ncbi:MAG TPA: prolipoprotein diacylglyceryl transferase family protein [Syntrophorhabdaceae bacterium]|nr:prolipoprotein diacylglyceryl transferase family protein [Syntrophorhabdaceae bacterium]
MLRRAALGLHQNEAWSLSILFAALSLIGGRVYELTVNEWTIFRTEPFETYRLWSGGIASEGVLLGAAIGIAIFCLIYKRSFLRVVDELVIPAAILLLFLGTGNHLSGEAYGPATTLWWGVKFPYSEGFRHPVAVYDVVRQLFMILVLTLVKIRTFPVPGRLLSNFIFWYGLSSIPVDYFRLYKLGAFGISTGLYRDMLIAAIGLLLIIRTAKKRSTAKFNIDTIRFAPAAILSGIPSSSTCNYGKVLLFILILLFTMIMPGSWGDHLIRQLSDKGGV